MEVFVIRDGQQLGPFSAEDTVTQMDEGKLSPDDWAWAAGLDEWQPLGKIFDVSNSTPPTSPQAATVSPDRKIRVIHDTALLVRLCRVLRSISLGWYNVIDNRLSSRAVLAAAAIALLASWLYPPWIHYPASRSHVSAQVPHGWFLLFDPQQREWYPGEIIMRIDVGRLILLDAVVLISGGLLAYAASRAAPSRRNVIVCATALIPLVSTVVIVAIAAPILVRGAERWVVAHVEVARRKAELRKAMDNTLSDVPSAKTLATVVRNLRLVGYSDDSIVECLTEKYKGFIPINELQGKRGYPISKGDGVRLKSYEEAWNAGYPVKADELTKLKLFDVTLQRPLISTNHGNAVAGTLRNDLPKSVKGVVLRVTFTRSAGEVINVADFKLGTGDIFKPGASQEFESEYHELGELPEGYTSSVEVTEATYAE